MSDIPKLLLSTWIPIELPIQTTSTRTICYLLNLKKLILIWPFAFMWKIMNNIRIFYKIYHPTFIKKVHLLKQEVHNNWEIAFFKAQNLKEALCMEHRQQIHFNFCRNDGSHRLLILNFILLTILLNNNKGLLQQSLILAFRFLKVFLLFWCNFTFSHYRLAVYSWFSWFCILILWILIFINVNNLLNILLILSQVKVNRVAIISIELID